VRGMTAQWLLLRGDGVVEVVDGFDWGLDF
jgi:hypothetical protein